MGQSADEIREQIEQTRAEMSETVDELAYKADVPARVRENVSGRIASVKGTIKDTISNAVGGASSAVGGATVNVRDASSTLREKADDMQDQARRNASMAVENPLGLLLAAFGVGLVAGLVIPASRLENEQLGPVKDELVNRAQTAASEAVEAGKSLVGEAVVNAATSAGTKGQEIAKHAMSPSGSSD